MKKIILILILGLFISKLISKTEDKIKSLNEISAFTFAIFSDNKGDSPKNSKIFLRMVNWIKENNDLFVIGLGDHVKKGWNNSFLNFLEKNQWWHDNFYPNIADGENAYYGWRQFSWGAGGEFLKTVNMDKNAVVKIRKNGCEYYLKRKIGKFTIHLIQLHFPDEPRDTKKSFRENSKEFMAKTLQKINKTDYDIVIVGAHSRNGFWYNELNDKQKNILNKKADLVLSATTHYFKRKIFEKDLKNAPLFINTGSITYPAAYSKFGFIQVNVLENPNLIVLQYINAAKNKMLIPSKKYTFIKLINGKIININLSDIKDFKGWKEGLRKTFN